MSGKTDTAALKASVNIVDVISRRLSLTKRGAEHYGICPFHNDHKESLQVNEAKQIFKCFACNAGGDVVDFLQEGGLTFHEAVDELQGKHGGNFTAPMRPVNESNKPKNDGLNAILPVPATAPEPTNNKTIHTKDGKEQARFIKRWEYRDTEGRLLGYTVRFEDRAGNKQIYPQIYAETQRGPRWVWKGLPTPRPLYRLQHLAKQPEASVLIVEGEKAADAAAKLLPHTIPMCWIGGAKGIKNADWTPLAGRKVIIWPDNDRAGCEAAADIAQALEGIAKLVRFIRPPEGTAKGWDIADAKWTKEQAREYAKANITQSVPEPNHLEPQLEPNPEPKPEPKSNIPDQPAFTPMPVDEDKDDVSGIPYQKFFKFLGFENYNGSLTYVFFLHGSNTVLRLGLSSLTKTAMLALVKDTVWWETYFPAKRGFSLDNAQSWIISNSERAGIYDPTKNRGRGAWMDNKRVVVHVGSHLLVDGKKTRLQDFKTQYIYQQARQMSYADGQPASTKQTEKLLDMLKLINWERPISPTLLAGWCVIAPISGALFWRPHIWITGAAGTGKSWVMDKVVRTLLGNIGLAVQGETSEAGLRQTLINDAVPVIFDEADTDSQADNQRIQKVLQLMRVSSTDDGGKIVKGSAMGKAQDFEIKSCFAVGSIAVQAAKAADISRLTVLTIKRNTDPADRQQRWDKLQRLMIEIMTPEFVQGIQARTVQMIPTILKNAKTFSAAVTAELNYQRTGDQIGTLLAGAYSLMRDGEVSYDAAVKWVREQSWDDERGIEDDKDEIQLLHKLMEQLIPIEGKDGRKFERTIAEALLIACGRKSDYRTNTYTDMMGETQYSQQIMVSKEEANRSLKRYGFRIDDTNTESITHFLVANRSGWIKNRLKDTGWSNNHHKVLQRIEGAETTGTVNFGGGVRTRAVRIPLELIDG